MLGAPSLVLAVLLAQGGPAQAQAQQCSACVRVSLAPGQALAAPAALHGAPVLVRVPAGTPADEWTPALDVVRAAGARAGLHLTSLPDAADPLVTAVDLLAIDVPDALTAQQAFALKQALARARGEHAGATLLLLAAPRGAAVLHAAGLEPYADAVLPAARVAPSAAEQLLEAPDAVWLLPNDVLDASRTLADVARLEVSLQPGLASTSEGSLRFGEGVNVAVARTLTADEIIARHQAFTARQSSRVRTRIASGTLTLTFEAPGFPAPVTVTSRTVMFVSPDGSDVQQQGISVNGVAFSADGSVPKLPLVEAERVVSPPLVIALSNVYRYRLEGRDAVRGRQCYVLSFSPRDRAAALFEGRAWIDASSFALARVAAAQTGLHGPITASEQADDFAPDVHGNWLLARSDIRQTYEGPSVRTPIHRLLVIERTEVNPPDFTARRAAAYASRDVMLRDTPKGYRYLARSHATAPSGGTVSPLAERTPASAATHVRTLAFGVIVDPNISQPLPFAGLSYVDFDLLHTGIQFSGFFGGSFAQAAFSAPSIRGTRWQVGGRAFAIASSYNDRAFERGREQYAQDVRQRPASASAWVLRPLTPRLSVRVQYDWEYTNFKRTEVSDPAFLIPASQVVHAARIGIDAQRAGWQGSAWWSPARRTAWRPWGYDTTAERGFQRYGVSGLRSAALSPRVAARVEVAWMGGRDLDRFSRYSFGTFDNRLHGYPSALVRYDRGGVLRTAIAWSAHRALRLDAFADTARVHDPGFGTGLKPYTGLGIAVEVPGPFGTLVATEWGYGIQGIDPDGHRGTNVIRISGYKVF